MSTQQSLSRPAGQNSLEREVKLYAVIRIRGRVDVPPDVEYTLKLLRLHRKNHCVIYPSTLPGIERMLHKVKDWVTWGEIDRETLIEFSTSSGRHTGHSAAQRDTQITSLA